MTKKLALTLITGFSILLFTACNKTIENMPPPQPGPTDPSVYVQFTANGVQLTGTPLYALISVENNSGQSVFSDKKVTLNNILGVYKTDKVTITKGEFRLSKFIIVMASDTAVYATPKSNSPKASQVATPLNHSFTISQKGINITTLEVLKISETDVPGNFGYTIDDFGFQPFLTLKIKLGIKEGQVLYDSLQGLLKIDAINGQQTHWIREIEMQKGLTEIRVPEQYSNFTFEVAKWNLVVRKVFNRSQLESNMLIELETTRQPKRLLKEASFIEISSDWVPESRSEYFYNGFNRLSEIKNYQKSTIVSGLPLTNIYKFTYSGNLLESINRFAADNQPTGSSEFFYSDAKIVNISNKSYDQQTHSVFEYSQSGKYNIIRGDYLFGNGNTMTYTMRYKDGNKVEDKAQSSTGGTEDGSYEYDNNINPKFQLGYPDLYFINHSKNNLKAELKSHGGSIPSAIPYKYEYVYDNDGYPVEALISYKGYTSHQHLYRIKKTYSYQ